MKVLLASAWEPELSPVRVLATDRLRDVDVSFVTLGVGVVEAAITTAGLLASTSARYDLAVFVGTAGAMTATLTDEPEVLVGAAVELVSASILTGDAEIPGPMPVVCPLDDGFLDAARSVGCRPVCVANTVGITVSEALARRVASRAQAEHLEAFGFARAASRAGVRCGVILGVANRVGPSGRDEWRARHAAASGRAAARAVDGLEAWLRTTTRSRSRGPA